MDDVLVRDAVSMFHNALCNQISAITEGLVCETAINAPESTQSVIRAPENGRTDLAVYLGPRRFEGPNIQRLHDHEHLRESTMFAAFDIKTTSVVIDNSGGGWITIRLTPDQREIRPLLLVTANQHPGYVAVVPVDMIMPDPQGKSHRTQVGRWRSTIHQLPGFPAEWGPFILPLDLLGRLLAGFRSWASGGEARWPHPQTGINLAPMIPDQIRRHPSSILDPTLPAWQVALDQGQMLYHAFQKHSRQHRVEYIRYSPMIGDLKILNVRDRCQVTFVELKAQQCEIQQCGDHTTIRHRQNAAGFSSRPIFSWRSCWDYLFTTLNEKWALFVPKHHIPTAWWNAPVNDGDGWVRWTNPQQAFSKYLVRRDSPSCLVSGIERILDTFGYRIRCSIPVRPLKWEEHEEVEDLLMQESMAPAEGKRDFTKAASDLREITAGFGHRPQLQARGDTLAEWSAHALMTLCRSRGTHVVLSFGASNARCSHALAPLLWSDEHKRRFDKYGEYPRYQWEFRREYLVVPIGFLSLRWIDGPAPSYHRAMTLRENCLILCDTYPWYGIRLRHGRFVIPHEHLERPSGTPDRRSGRPDPRARVRLQHGVIDDFYVDEPDVIDALLEPLQGRAPATAAAGLAAVRSPASYVCTLGEIWEAGAQALQERLERQPPANDPQDLMESGEEDRSERSDGSSSRHQDDDDPNDDDGHGDSTEDEGIQHRRGGDRD